MNSTLVTVSDWNRNRRRFLKDTAGGLGALALARLLHGSAQATRAPGHWRPKAKRVVYLFQSGGAPQMETLDHKPELARRRGEEVPDSIFNGQRLTGMTAGQSSFPVAPSVFDFRPHGQSGQWISEVFPHLGKIADDIAIVNSMVTEAINHDPAITFLQTGFQIAGRPSMGAWLSYGLGSENDNLPAFVSMLSGSGGQPLYDRLWGSGFLPSNHQGVRFRSGSDPVLYLNNPAGVSRGIRRTSLDAIADLNRLHAQEVADPEIENRITQYEMAYRMQASVPELTDVSKEPESVFRLYGEAARKPGTYAYNALLARRLLERGVPFVQLFHRGWDTHNNLANQLRARVNDTDQASTALVQDLKARGLLDDTIVLWGSEFGRTVYCQGDLGQKSYGRDHHPRCFSMWMAGGGLRPGHTYGKTDDYSYNIVENPVSVHDLHATLLHLMGIDHERLTYRFQGRDFRLTDVHGKVLRALVSA